MTSPPSVTLRVVAASCLIAAASSVPAIASGALPASPPTAAGHVRGPADADVRHGGPRHDRTWRTGAWRGPGGRGWEARRFDRRTFGWGWGAFGGGWTAFAPGWAETEPLAPLLVQEAEILRPRLPTAADLPLAGQRAVPVAPAVLFSIDDRSHGRSGRAAGAKIVSATKPTPLPGASPSGVSGSGGPLIIHLTAR